MFDTRGERIATGAGNLFFLAAIILFITLILLTTGTVQAQDSLLPSGLDDDALEPDALATDALDPDALGLEPGDFHELLVSIGESDPTLLAFCYWCQEWFDVSVGHNHKAWYPWWMWPGPDGRDDVPLEYWWSFGKNLADEYGTGIQDPAHISPPGGASVPAMVIEKAPGSGGGAVPGMTRKTTERSRSVPAVVERSPGRAQGRIKR